VVCIRSRPTHTRDFDAFNASLTYTIKGTARVLNEGWLVGLQLIGRIYLLLTSWTIFNLLGNSALAQFRTQTGLSAYMPFAIIGFSFEALIMQAAWSGAYSIRIEAEFGTLEAVFLTPSSKIAWLLGKIAANLLLALLSTAIVLIVGISAFSFPLNGTPDIPSAILGVALTLVGMTAFAFALAGLTFLVKKAEEINQVLWTSMVFFSGLAFPVEALPNWARAISEIFPITQGLEITRGAVLKGTSVFDPTGVASLEVILILIAFYLPIGYFSFKRFLKQAKRKGALANY